MKKKLLLIISIAIALLVAFSIVAMATDVDEGEGMKPMEFKINVEGFTDSVIILCYGMLGIFIVTAVIIIFVLVLNTVVEIIEKKKGEKNNK